MTQSRNFDRIAETMDGLDRLTNRIATWFSRRRDADFRRQYWTQLQALEQVLQPCTARVRQDISTIGDRGIGETYAACRRNDRRIHLLERYWRYFADKWDQRDGEYRDTLLAADEIVWSCWKTPFEVAGYPIAAAPLPYLEPFYSPRAIPRSQPPADVQRADALLRAALAILPVPLIGLPPVVHARPWWLAVLAHEIGHHLQYDLGDGKFRTGLGQSLQTAAAKAGADPGPWRGWHEEIFADACSILLLGPAAAAATTEMIRTSDTLMITEDAAYPSAFLRQHLMSEMLSLGGGPSAARVPSFEPDHLRDFNLAEEELQVQAKSRLTAVTTVAADVIGQSLPDGAVLPVLCGWQPGPYTEQVTYWRDQLLRARPEPVPEKEPHTARTALAGGVAAWQQIAGSDDPDFRAEAHERLAKRLRTLLPRCRPGGQRDSSPAADADVHAAGNALGDALFGAAVHAEAE